MKRALFSLPFVFRTGAVEGGLFGLKLDEVMMLSFYFCFRMLCYSLRSKLASREANLLAELISLRERLNLA